MPGRTTHNKQRSNAQVAMVTYKIHPRFNGYRVGTDGTVWSLWVRGSNPRRLGSQWNKLSPARNSDGHRTLEIHGKTQFVHHLVLETFVGPRPNGMQARHFPDRNPANNAITNLSWATPKENQGDRVVHGTHCRGSRCYAAKLTEDQVRQIRAEYAAGGISQRLLARKFGISQGPLSAIVLRKSWVDVA